MCATCVHLGTARLSQLPACKRKRVLATTSSCCWVMLLGHDVVASILSIGYYVITWHSVGQDPLPGTPYDAESLDVDDLCEQGLPWVAQEWSIPTELVQQQHYFRAIEEQQIIKREAANAEAFYSHYVRQCKIVQEASAE